MEHRTTAAWHDVSLDRFSASALPSCSLIDVAVVSIVAIVTMLVAHTPADADLWGHLRFGADLLGAGHLPLRDLYSFTSDVPWINHEWLAELTLAAFYTRFGAIGAIVFKMMVLGAAALLMWTRVRRASGTPFSATVLVALVVIATSTRTQTLRPQLFSALLFTALLAIIDRLERDDRRAIVAVPLLFGIWANTHGAWLVGLGVFGVWAAAGRRFGLLALAVAATLLNPYGVGLWTFLRSTVGLARPEISDWRPFLALPPSIIAFELMLAAAAAISVWTTRRPIRRVDAAILTLLSIAMLRISRVDAFVQIAIAWLCAPALAQSLNRLEERLRRSHGLNRRRPAHAFAAAAIALAALTFTAVEAGRITIAGEWIPDAEALRFIKGGMAGGRLLTWFDWGEYAIWHLSPAIRVSMDGRRETVYSDRVIRDHFTFYANASSEAWRYPDRIGADRLWLPRTLPIVVPLEQHGWRPIFESGTSVVLARTSDMATVERPAGLKTAKPGPAIFPGP